MPLEEEIQTLQLYMDKELDKIAKDTFAVWDTRYYVKARSLGNNFALFVETGVNLPILFMLKCIKHNLSLYSKYFHNFTPFSAIESRILINFGIQKYISWLVACCFLNSSLLDVHFYILFSIIIIKINNECDTLKE